MSTTDLRERGPRDDAPAAGVHAATHLHREPPLTVAGVLLRHRWTVPAILATFGSLALAAVFWVALLRTWDEPVRSWISDNRTDWLDTFFLYATRLGSWQMVVIGLTVLLAIAWRVCAPMATLLVVATLARPVCEWLLKTGVGRDRPVEGGLVESGGPSFPSGHVMAAVALWGLVPPVVALMTRRRSLWWIATVVSGAIILVVAVSRVYMGVHWMSDVVGGLLFGAVYLLVIEWLADRSHRRYPCAAYADGCADR
jgi:undecaprenyl-diphosphatase